MQLSSMILVGTSLQIDANISCGKPTAGFLTVTPFSVKAGAASVCVHRLDSARYSTTCKIVYPKCSKKCVHRGSEIFLIYFYIPSVEAAVHSLDVRVIATFLALVATKL